MGDVITVFGASGFIGKYVVRALCARGCRVRAATRRPHIAQELRVMGAPGQVQLVQANVRDRASVARAVEGASAVVNLTGVLHQHGRQKFLAVHAQGARNIAEAARDAGVTRFALVSAIGADEKSASAYARSKAEGERAVLEILPTATILRPSVVFGPEDEFFNKFADLLRFVPSLVPVPILIRGGKSKMQPVFVRDVAEAVARVLERADAQGRVYELGGPNVYTFKELLKFTLDVVDRPRLLMPAFGPIGFCLGLFGEIVGAVPFFEPPITRDQVRLLATDNVVGASGEDVGVLADLSVEPATIEAIVPGYLERYRRNGQFHTSRIA